VLGAVGHVVDHEPAQVLGDGLDVVGWMISVQPGPGCRRRRPVTLDSGLRVGDLVVVVADEDADRGRRRQQAEALFVLEQVLVQRPLLGDVGEGRDDEQFAVNVTGNEFTTTRWWCRPATRSDDDALLGLTGDRRPGTGRSTSANGEPSALTTRQPFSGSASEASSSASTPRMRPTLLLDARAARLRPARARLRRSPRPRRQEILDAAPAWRAVAAAVVSTAPPRPTSPGSDVATISSAHGFVEVTLQSARPGSPGGQPGEGLDCDRTETSTRPTSSSSSSRNGRRPPP
jgi:hypothetical protein